MQQHGGGYYTISSAGHEGHATLAAALLHYRSGGFYCARARQVAGVGPVCGAKTLRVAWPDAYALPS